MLTKVQIVKLTKDDYSDLSLMVGELLTEIMEKIQRNVFTFDPKGTQVRTQTLIEDDKYWVFLAKDNITGKNLGFISIYESYALYAEGEYGTIPELYIRPKHRSQNIGQLLLQTASEFAASKQWQRLEVTTPPLPTFKRTLDFYQKNGFEATGGLKLKLNIKA